MGSPYGAIDFFFGGGDLLQSGYPYGIFFGGQNDFVYVFFLNPRGVQAATERLSLRDIFGGQDDFVYVFFLNPRGVQAATERLSLRDIFGVRMILFMYFFLTPEGFKLCSNMIRSFFLLPRRGYPSS